MKKGDYFKAIDEFFSVKPHGVRDLELPGGVRCSKSPTTLESTLDISKSKVIPSYCYLKVNFIVPETFEISVL